MGAVVLVANQDDDDDDDDISLKAVDALPALVEDSEDQVCLDTAHTSCLHSHTSEHWLTTRRAIVVPGLGLSVLEGAGAGVCCDVNVL